MSEIRCTISNCEYWGSDSLCQSPEILVAAGPPESQDDSMPNMTMQTNSTPVQDDIETHCHTFEPK